ncbi:histidinol-phosphatase [Salpingoeca rosetta]|uniref:histidinol-phosphatase n=1 Tax=Salpingoeca rosetta (strain ATCC 50818 / BSB-021) TaxID=946362 RepID=F2UDH8_SALR5|nr:histidinol-phosphatase [Salpingoeca rosetta]EGD74673.1 histidinol-phosphatase [Salpingoeca rosetta]|eukprot:XP_004992930.1 histidinol-phosphatase [Salpingoeca rosetta]
MVFSYHSHSGQFCKHAAETLEANVLAAIELGFTHLGLSEHMPRYCDEHLYPEEKELGMTPADLEQQFDAYVQEARRVKAKYADKIHLVIGFETEMCRPESVADALHLMQKYSLSYCVGSVHHVNGVPIDFDEPTIARVEKQLGSTEALFVRYFELVKEMIEGIKPAVVGHFDLIRLLRPQQPLTERILAAADAAINAAVKHNCLFEINTAALRKGLQGPYPHADLALRIAQRGARFTISGDSHCPDFVATCYAALPAYLDALGVDAIWYLEADEGKPALAHLCTDWRRWFDTHCQQQDGKEGHVVATDNTGQTASK